jgi:DNA-binding PadR family transcriptional regulator
MGEESGRFFRHGELPLVLLTMIAEQPRHAYQLLARLERLFSPHYEPSTGSVYPAVTALVESGLVDVKQDGRRRVYSMTPKGRRTLDRSREALAALETRTGVHLTAVELDRVIARFASRLRGDADVDLAMLEKELDGIVTRLSTK